MRILLKSIVLNGTCLAVFAATGFCQGISDDAKKQVDAVVQEAYQSATAIFPCKLRAGGEPKMLRWEKADKCLNAAHDSVDWESVSSRLREIQNKSGVESADFLSAVEASLSAHAVTYDRVFEVKDKKVLLPLSNSILKFLPPDSLLDLPVTDRASKKIGTFSGVFIFEKVGEISGTIQRHALFQYKDVNGKMQSSPERLLLDSFGVPWSDAMKQGGFRLPVDRINLRRTAGERESLSPKIPRKLS
jgi:hypothetical protein